MNPAIDNSSGSSMNELLRLPPILPTTRPESSRQAKCKQLASNGKSNGNGNSPCVLSSINNADNNKFAMTATPMASESNMIAPRPPSSSQRPSQLKLSRTIRCFKRVVQNKSPAPSELSEKDLDSATLYDVLPKVRMNIYNTVGYQCSSRIACSRPRHILIVIMYGKCTPLTVLRHKHTTLEIFLLTLIVFKPKSFKPWFVLYVL